MHAPSTLHLTLFLARARVKQNNKMVRNARALTPLPNTATQNAGNAPARQVTKRKRSYHAMQRQNIALRQEISSQLSSTRVVVGLKQTECAGLRERILMRGHDRLLRVDRDVLHHTHLPDTPDALRAAVAPTASSASPSPDRGSATHTFDSVHASNGCAVTNNGEAEPDTPNTLNATLRSALVLAEARHREASTVMDHRLHLLQLQVHEMSPCVPVHTDVARNQSESIGLCAPSSPARTTVLGAEASSSSESAPRQQTRSERTQEPTTPLHVTVTAQRQYCPGWLRTDGSYVVYGIKICSGARSKLGMCESKAMVGTKRFSALLRCHQRLVAALQANRSTAHTVRLQHAFPRREMKLLVDHLDPAFVERRRARLELYVRSVALAFRATTPQQLAQLFTDEAEDAVTVLL